MHDCDLSLPSQSQLNEKVDINIIVPKRIGGVLAKNFNKTLFSNNIPHLEPDHKIYNRTTLLKTGSFLQNSH